MPRALKIPPEERDKIRAEFIAARAAGVPVKLLMRRYNISRSYFRLVFYDLDLRITRRRELPEKT